MSGNTSKIICVGWHKTGTSTIGEALHKLGYDVVGARLDTAEDLLNGDKQKVIDLAAHFDALQDVPWAALYKELDQAFPGSKFILTLRDDESWLKSAYKHFGRSGVDRPMFRWLYGVGTIRGNKELFLERYKRHNREVMAYFKERPDDLLIMSFENGDGWDKLCPFIGHPIPLVKTFPHRNQGKHNYSMRKKIYYRFKATIPSPLRKAVFNLRLRILTKMGYKDPRDIFNNRKENRKVREMLRKDLNS